MLLRTARLEPIASSAGEARRIVRQALSEIGESGALHAAELAVSELATNAILHAATALEVTVEVTATWVTVSVRDWHPRLPTQRHWGATATTGRGLALVASVTDEFGVDLRQPTGKSVWFRLARGAASDNAGLDAAWDIDALMADLDRPDAHAVQLLGLPVRLWSAGQQQWEAGLRELYLYAQSPGLGPDEQVDLVAAGRALSVLSRAVRQRVSEAVATVPSHVDVTLTVEADEHHQYAALQEVLDLGLRMSAARQMLLPHSLPEIVALRDWACEQVLEQVHDAPPTTWSGVDDSRFLDPAQARHAAPAPVWDTEYVTQSVRSLLAADDHNRIIAVSASLAATLGWDVDELTGHRVVTIVPPALREAHVAHFTHHLTTGEASVLGVELESPLRRADGSEILCRVVIERTAAEGGRSVYVAQIDPVED